MDFFFKYQKFKFLACERGRCLFRTIFALDFVNDLK